MPEYKAVYALIRFYRWTGFGLDVEDASSVVRIAGGFGTVEELALACCDSSFFRPRGQVVLHMWGSMGCLET